MPAHPPFRRTGTKSLSLISPSRRRRRGFQPPHTPTRDCGLQPRIPPLATLHKISRPERLIGQAQLRVPNLNPRKSEKAPHPPGGRFTLCSLFVTYSHQNKRKLASSQRPDCPKTAPFQPFFHSNLPSRAHRSCGNR